MKFLRAFFVLLSTIGMVSVVHSAPWFQITDLGTFGQASAEALSVNNSGQVSGSINNDQAFLWDSGGGGFRFWAVVRVVLATK